MTRKLLVLALPALLLLGGCVSVQATRIGTPTQYAPVPTEHVLVYRTEGEVDRPFERVAMLWVEGDADVVDNRRMVDAARKKAGRLGANAVVLGEFQDPKLGTRILGHILDLPVERRASLLAIRVRADSAAATAQAAR